MAITPNEIDLLNAIKKRDWKTAETLIQQGANVNAKDENQDTPLLLAIKHKHWPIVSELIKLGADIHARDIDGYTPIILLSEVDNLPIGHQFMSKITIDDIKRAQESKKLMQIIKESGHILGFTTSIAGIRPETLIVGFEQGHQGHLLLEKLIKKNMTPEFQEIQEALNLATEYYQKNGTTHKAFIEYYKTGRCTILPVAWPGHAITLLAWNDILVICNRGSEKLKEGISVFKMPSDLSNEFLETIMPNRRIPDKEEVLKGIYDFIGAENIKNPILTFPSLDQKYGTCGFVNLKSSLQAILFFMHLLQSQHKTPEQFNLNFLESYLTQNKEQFSAIMVASKQQYKHFTKAIRDQQINELCDAFKRLDPGSEERKIYFEIFCAIMFVHHGEEINSRGHRRSPEKIEAESARFRQMLALMTQEEEQKLTLIWIALFGTEPEIYQLERHAQNQNRTLALETQITEGGDTTLLLAIKHKRWETAKVLIRLGANVNAKDKNQNTPLIWAASQQDLDGIRILIEEAAAQNQILEFEACNKDGKTALSFAMEQNNVDMQTLLLETPAKISDRFRRR